jgi:hypothetical protein
MKKIVFFIIILFPDSLFADSNIFKFECILGYFTYSYSNEFNGKENISYNTLGQEFLFATAGPFFNLERGIHILGTKYKWNKNNGMINLNYLIYYTFSDQLHIDEVFGIGVGPNISIGLVGTNTLTLGPQIDLMYGSLLKVAISYRFNINIDKKYSHEILFTIGIFDYLKGFFDFSL